MIKESIGGIEGWKCSVFSFCSQQPNSLSLAELLLGKKKKSCTFLLDSTLGVGLKALLLGLSILVEISVYYFLYSIHLKRIKVVERILVSFLK